MTVNPIGILGGSFDPIHLAHLRTALEVRDMLDLSELRFFPCGQPPHRTPPVATAQQRVAMLQLAIAGEPGLIVDEREIQREGPCYTFFTLQSLRVEFPAVPLCLIIGADQFVNFDTWHRWQEILGLAHLVVVYRPGWNPTGQIGNAELARLVQEHTTIEAHNLRDVAGGQLFFAQVSQFDLSSSRIRALLRQGKSVRYLVPDAVYDYIRSQNLYNKAAGGL